jgi:LytS/YehU family sensor histidine kinase
MLSNLWSLITDPVILCLTFLILWLYAIQNRKKVQYQLEGRLSNQHTINNLLMNSISIENAELQVKYLLFISKFVNYGFVNQDKYKVNIRDEMDQVLQMISAYEISSESEVQFDIEIDDEHLQFDIIPFSIITIVENALNYGELEDSRNQLKIKLTLLDSLYKISFSGYKLPTKVQISKPRKGHGLYILKGRLKYYHFDHNSNSVRRNEYLRISDDNQLLEMILPK